MRKRDIAHGIGEAVAGIILVVLVGAVIVYAVGSFINWTGEIINWTGEITLYGSVGAVLKWWGYGMIVMIVLLIVSGLRLADLEPKGSCGGSFITGGIVGLILYICDTIWGLPL